MKFARIVFNIAAVYGFLVLLPQYALERRIGADHPPAITHPEYFYGFVGVALAWQVMFVLIARDPARYRAAMIPSMLEKLAFGGAAVALYAADRLAASMLAFGAIDFVFATLFAIAYRVTTPSSR